MSHTKKIDLGRSLGEELGNIKPLSPNEKHYPTLHLDGEDERLADLPDKGSAEIHFRVIQRIRHENGRDKDKKRSHSVTLEIISIEPGHDAKFNGKKTTSFVDSAREGFNKNFK